MPTIEQIALPHGIELECRVAGPADAPVLMFLHGFPEGAFAWDELVDHFARTYRCVAPNLRGFAGSSSPVEPREYRSKALVHDIAALIQTVSPDRPLAALVAHDWGGATAWNLANSTPELLDRLVIINSPHAATFLRDMQTGAEQQAASQYMHVLSRDDAEQLFSENDYARLWVFLEGLGAAKSPDWLTDSVRDQYREVWEKGLTGGLNYYRVSPVKPPLSDSDAMLSIELPRQMLTVDVPTMVIWGMRDEALLPNLLVGLDDYVPNLTIHRIDDASHWVVHEQPETVIDLIEDFLA